MDSKANLDSPQTPFLKAGARILQIGLLCSKSKSLKEVLVDHNLLNDFLFYADADPKGF